MIYVYPLCGVEREDGFSVMFIPISHPSCALKTHENIEKGKTVLDESPIHGAPIAPIGSNRRVEKELRYKKPPEECVKLNSDDDFVVSLSQARCGMVLCDDTNTVIFTICRELSTWGSAP